VDASDRPEEAGVAKSWDRSSEHRVIVQSVVAWIVLPLTYAVTDPAKNINWVFGIGLAPQRRLSPRFF
jgi:hypothetical protein